MSITPSGFPIKSSLRAAVLLLALDIVHEARASFPTTAAQVLALTDAGKTQAYQMRERLGERLGELLEPSGRRSAPAADANQLANVAIAVRDFVMSNPGVVSGHGIRRTYSDSFRRFIIELFAPQGPARDLTIEQASEAAGVPLGTIKDWLREPKTPPGQQPCTQSGKTETVDPLLQCAQPEIATLLSEYEAWKGDLSAFCQYAAKELKLPFGRSLLTHILTAAGMYSPKSRGGPHSAPWSRGSLVTHFPGAQWFGDGKQLRVNFQENSFLFNIEAFVDAASNATVAARVTDTENASAVIDAFHEGLETTAGQVPLATTLDNRPSNFSPEINEALSCTELLRATPGRGQAKAPVEGAFGLFEQALPSAIVINGDAQRDIARSVGQAVVHAFFLGRNGRPRGKLGGRTPAQAYDETQVTQQQIDQAKSWILELRRREQIARQTRERRADPVRLQLLCERLAALGIDDPKGQSSLALSGYSMAAIVRGLAVFQTKMDMGTLPRNADLFRYLGGIIRNIDSHEALERTAQHLLDLRLRAGELYLGPLREQATAIHQSKPADAAVADLVDAALHAHSLLVFRFWTSQTKQAFSTLPSSQALALYRHTVRIIAASFDLDTRWREQLISSLASAVALSTA